MNNNSYVSVHLCVPEDQARHLPKRRRAPHLLPRDVPLPRTGDVIYLNPQSAWGVQMVVYQWDTPDALRIEVWLEYVANSRHTRPSGFSLTQ